MNIATLCVNCKLNSSCVMCWRTSDKKCPNFIQKTNADKIRAMNDEDMAKWIDWLFGRCEWCDTDKIATDDCNDVECTPCILKWLKQPFEGE